MAKACSLHNDLAANILRRTAFERGDRNSDTTRASQPDVSGRASAQPCIKGGTRSATWIYAACVCLAALICRVIRITANTACIELCSEVRIIQAIRSQYLPIGGDTSVIRGVKVLASSTQSILVEAERARLLPAAIHEVVTKGATCNIRLARCWGIKTSIAGCIEAIAGVA